MPVGGLRSFDDYDLEELAKEVLLHVAEVRLWLGHLTSVVEIRRRGAVKMAAKKRPETLSGMKVSEVTLENGKEGSRQNEKNVLDCDKTNGRPKRNENDQVVTQRVESNRVRAELNEEHIASGKRCAVKQKKLDTEKDMVQQSKRRLEEEVPQLQQNRSKIRS